MAAETSLKVSPPPHLLLILTSPNLFIIVQFKGRTHCSIEINLHYMQ